ncbi:D-lactate dehydrogenase [Staphylococcus auricularis]|uniref:D-lactate dehydrogenase n=1 Tax=Staphylococcus auricularis TaxID=29379 RepID=A0AAW7MFQ4_9STAP|nr:D-lactate dehydrogenase [Staphylococcus auricularis]MDC6327368.1 D-lactate dehydrogenase [Staphylococcus auricularis]MDN4534059.1 D-lactate dehydrogenase [Staphylococcus auricularis]
MVSIKLFGVREEDKPFIKQWAETHDVEVSLTNALLTNHTVDQVEGFDGVSVSQQLPLDEIVFKKLNQYGIKQIAQRSAGFDMYDLDLASKYDVIISNVPSYSPNSIAEYTVGQAINVVRHFNAVQRKTAEHDFRWEPSILSRSIKDLTVAVVGTGRIGSIVADIFAKGFGSQVVAYDVVENERLDGVVTYKDTLIEAVEEADIVTVHVPGGAETNYLFDENVFSHFKQDAVFVNCARGSVTDTKALLKYLDNGRLLGAALDTYEGEKGLYPSDQRNTDFQDDLLQQLIDREDVIVSPHIAFYTDAAVENLIVYALDATLDVIQTGDTELRVN